ncbi:hypothetical protein TSTA_006410 [Talaromyces stipitatus ATCC 10500]|uniref:Uncharacterized protein n=1 Tax=Talaromyces stipitatus (strain ATCC 10500 / CBS 375.48 / QM 6759 / NRRL 1006) TaxID=441959 RepID=B8MTY5_TALSN|nr:uncharacterized protein TSTA_006410 [Talaromyces stipitatus ATCC 10500]EED12617.1 hypothetical protein TSTA_006410 [Talaromyces stipitatus ATCC 10500]
MGSSLAASASSDSVGGRIHQHIVSPTMPPSAYDVSYPKSHSLSELGNHSRVEPIQRDSVYGNGFIDEIYSTPYNLHSSASGTMAEYYSPLGGGRTWNSVPAPAMTAELEQSQNAIFYTTDVPSFYSTANTLSSEDLTGNRLLPVPTSSGPPSGHGSSTTSNFRDAEGTTSGQAFMTGVDTGNVYFSGLKSLSSSRAKSISTSIPFSSMYDTSGMLSREEKPEVHSPSQNLMRYSGITDSALTMAPATSFPRSGTADSSDLEDPLIMSMNGIKGSQDDGYNKTSKSPVYGYRLRDRHDEYVTRSDSGSYSHTRTFLHSLSNVRGLSLSHQGY